jgi:molybdopterin-guanine dinucleotide biosynthesis protein A
MPADAHQPVAAAILAGGRARRMGGLDKASLHVGGLRIVDRQVAVLHQVADPVFVVANDAAPFANLGLRVVPDALPGAGALGGLYSALAASPAPRTLVVACDMPFLSVPLLRRLTQPSDADAVMPRSPRGLEPLCAVYSAAAAGAIRRRIEEGDLKMARLAADLRVEELGPEVLAAYDPQGLLFVNVNTPHDYERALGLVETVSKPPGDRITDNTEIG